jgi:cytochrome oxidase Cu insertion factor (SCO1/SenC/PrrC family)
LPLFIYFSSILPAVGVAPDRPRTLAGNLGAQEHRALLCRATCPILTAKMAAVQDQLGSDFGPKIAFLSITVDPEHDTPEVLQRYADTFGANPIGWKFLTGSPAVIQDIERQYGVFAAGTREGKLDHINLTSLVDCQVAEHYWDPVGHAIVRYGYLFDRLIQARQREV